MRRLLSLLALVVLIPGSPWETKTAIAVPVKPCIVLYVPTDVDPRGVELVGADRYVFAGQRLCFRGEVESPIGYSRGYPYYRFRVETGGAVGWILEDYVTTSPPQVWPQAEIVAEWPQRERDGSTSWVQKWTDGSYVSWTIEEAPLSWQPPESPEPPSSPVGQWAKVTYVIDGDTFEATIDGDSYRVRLFGVDTPEWGQACYYEARSAAQRLLGQGTYLERDVRNTDNYGRLLRYAFGSDGQSIDAALVAGGYGYAWRRDGKYRDWIVGIEEDARQNGVGCLWGW